MEYNFESPPPSACDKEGNGTGKSAEHSRRTSARGEQLLRLLSAWQHDLRTPASALVSGVRLLRGGKSIQDSSAVLDAMDRQARDLAELITLHGELMRLACGLVVFEPQCVPAGGIIEAVVAEVNSMGRFPGHHIALRDFGRPPACRADPARLKLLFETLIHSAVEFSTPEAEIAVNVAEEPGLTVIMVTYQSAAALRTVPDMEALLSGSLGPELSRPQALRLVLAGVLCERQGGDLVLRSIGGCRYALAARLPNGQDPATGG